jgi:hypothetical protein
MYYICGLWPLRNTKLLIPNTLIIFNSVDLHNDNILLNEGQAYVGERPEEYVTM